MRSRQSFATTLRRRRAQQFRGTRCNSNQDLAKAYSCLLAVERTEIIDLGGGITGTAHHPRWVGSDYRIGASILLGSSSWLVRPALAAGIQYDGGDYFEPTAGASLTFGRRYGARFILNIEECGSTACARFQMGGYVSF